MGAMSKFDALLAHIVAPTVDHLVSVADYGKHDATLQMPIGTLCHSIIAFFPRAYFFYCSLFPFISLYRLPCDPSFPPRDSGGVFPPDILVSHITHMRLVDLDSAHVRPYLFPMESFSTPHLHNNWIAIPILLVVSDIVFSHRLILSLSADVSNAAMAVADWKLRLFFSEYFLPAPPVYLNPIFYFAFAHFQRCGFHSQHSAFARTGPLGIKLQYATHVIRP